jgi:glutamine synthetase
MKNAHSIYALTNASTNSYMLIVKGFEAPTLLAYSARNRDSSSSSTLCFGLKI